MTAASKARITKRIRTLAKGVVPIIALYLEVGWREQGFQTRFRLHGLGSERLVVLRHPPAELARGG